MTKVLTLKTLMLKKGTMKILPLGLSTTTKKKDLRGSEDDTRPLRDNGGDRDVRVHQDQRYSTVINLGGYQ
ncbi:hypothetical protein L917_19682 [Phytophthora nicotianae]|uniref:Uncharacterized protein n=1 Tax=Phytophthora nicotianae TaxID=4792 RepID=W2JWW5_PHYNI|nr:hypothetical protein L917_21623 [Phytophthora nicotianae]ETL79745.1 hypothetical protein L917_19682 [Phytophthora nicotianae]